MTGVRVTRPPWQRVREELRAPEVAEWLGLEKARERGKWACPVCNGSDPLHAYPEPGRGFYCWGGCGGKAYSVIDLAAAALNVEPAEACQQLASWAGIIAVDAPPAVQRRRRAPRPSRPAFGPPGRSQAVESPPAPSPEALRARGEVYQAFLHYGRLTERGAGYLAGRGLDPEAAGGYGFRSLDGPGSWREVAQQLARFYSLSDLAAAGLHPLPFAGRAPALLIPYWGFGCRLDAIRFRNLGEGGAKYLTLAGNPPSVPFQARDLATLEEGGELHVTEGELDAWTLRAVGLRAIGLPGTGFVWRRAWNAHVRRAGRLVLWPDPDEPGDRAAGRFAATLQAAFGRAWLEAHGRRVDLETDVNEVHQRGMLAGIVEAADWRR